MEQYNPSLLIGKIQWDNDCSRSINEIPMIYSRVSIFEALGHFLRNERCRNLEFHFIFTSIFSRNAYSAAVAAWQRGLGGWGALASPAKRLKGHWRREWGTEASKK